MKKQIFVFDKKNYTFVIAGIVLIIIGYMLMAGGGSDNPEVFNPEIFSARRLVVAPLLVLAGLFLQVLAIMLKGSSSDTDG